MLFTNHQEVAKTILFEIKSKYGSVKKFSKKVGIPPSTLRYRLVEKPSILSIQDLEQIAPALGVEITIKINSQSEKEVQLHKLQDQFSKLQSKVIELEKL